MRVTLARMAKSPRRTMYMSEFPLHQATISKLHNAMIRGLKVPAIVRAYLMRVKEFDHKIHAITSKLQVSKAVKNSVQLEEKWKKEAIEAGDIEGFLREKPLYGVYLCVKDNILTQGIQTRVGSMAMKESHAIRANVNSPVVQRLRNAGAIILLKGNMHEFGMAGMTLSSCNGQTHNPYDLTRTPGGSSGGVAAAVAEGYVTAGVGTDTMNSLRSPASACNVVGFRPTKGKLDMTGIFPVAPTQDQVGPITKCVQDARTMFSVMAGTWEDDVDRKVKLDFDGIRIGILENYGPEHPHVSDVYNGVLSALERSGAEMVSLRMPEWDIEEIRKLDVQRFEFKKAFEEFMKENLAVDDKELKDPPMTLQDLLDKMEKYKEWAAAQAAAEKEAALAKELEEMKIQEEAKERKEEEEEDEIELIGFETEEERRAKMKAKRWQNKLKKDRKKAQLKIPYDEKALRNTAFWPAMEEHTQKEYEDALARLEKFRMSVDRELTKRKIDILMYPHQNVLMAKIEDQQQDGRNGLLAALTGNPAICIPAGFTTPSLTAPRGLPIGVEMMGRAGKDHLLLDIAEMVEYILNVNSTFKTPPGIRKLTSFMFDATRASRSQKSAAKKKFMEEKRRRRRGIFNDYSNDPEMAEIARQIDEQLAKEVDASEVEDTFDIDNIPDEFEEDPFATLQEEEPKRKPKSTSRPRRR